MKQLFKIELSKQEMLKFFENKIVEDEACKSNEGMATICLSDYSTNSINLEKYRKEIIELLYKDYRVANVEIGNDNSILIDIYKEFCPFYYDEEESESVFVYQDFLITHFSSFLKTELEKREYVDLLESIKFFSNEFKKDKIESGVYNFIKGLALKIGFIDKYLEDTKIYVTKESFMELEEKLKEEQIKIREEIDVALERKPFIITNINNDVEYEEEQ